MAASSAPRILFATFVLALVAGAWPTPARAEAPASGDQYHVPVSGLPEGADSLDECEVVDGVEVCLKIDLALDVDGGLSGSAEIALTDGPDSLNYSGPVSGSIRGVIGDGTRPGWTRLRLRIDLSGTARIGGRTLDSTFRMNCSARAVHGEPEGPGSCRARICVRGGGCVGERLPVPLELGTESLLNGELIVDVDTIDRNRAQGGGELVVDGQSVAALDMKGQVNEKRGFGNLLLRPSAGGRSRIQIKRAEVEQGEISKARVIFLLFGHRGRIDVAR